MIASGILEATSFLNPRLPEAFAGYSRERTEFSVESPSACRPQTWATGAPLLLRTRLGMDEVDGRLIVEPALPKEFRHVGLLDVPGRWGTADAFGRPGCSRRTWASLVCRACESNARRTD